MHMLAGKLTFAASAAGAVLMTSVTFAQDGFDAIYDSCKADLQLSDSGCDCVIAETKAKLNENQITFFAAAITNNAAAMVEAQGKLTGDEMLELTEFMTVTPSTCQNQ